MGFPWRDPAAMFTSSRSTWREVGFSSIAMARLPEEPYPVHCSSPILSLTACRNRCLQPRYRKCAAAHLRYYAQRFAMC